MELTFPNYTTVAAKSGEGTPDNTNLQQVLALPEKAEATASVFPENVSKVEATVSAETQQVSPRVNPKASTVAKYAKLSRRRRANPAHDHIWYRHHAKCVMAAVCDLALGGYGDARSGANPLKGMIKAAHPGKVLLDLCPWILNASYLNFEGSGALQKRGLERCFKEWAANRVYYFYYGEEHPALGKRNNLRNVYRQFYDTFAVHVEAGTPISEEHARQFWQAVAHIVPFKEPASATSAAVEAASATVPRCDVVTDASNQAAIPETL